MSGVGSSTISRHAVVLLELAVGGDAGPEVGDGGGHHDDVGVGVRPATAACISAAVSTASTDARRRDRQLDGARASVTSAPRAAASAATA